MALPEIELHRVNKLFPMFCEQRIPTEVREQIKEAKNVLNEVLKMVGEEPIQRPTEGTARQRLEALLEIYTERLVGKNPQYKAFKNKKDIPDMIVMYLNKMIAQQKSAC